MDDLSLKYKTKISKSLNEKIPIFFDSLKAAWPICIGYIPLGFASGVLSQKAGLTPTQIGILSILVFSGSAQFIASSMLINNASSISIISATLIINFRHFLMSSSLAPYFKGKGKRFLLLFSYGITDETFAINLNKFENNNWNSQKAFYVNQIAYITWVLSNILGGYTGFIIPFNGIIINYFLTSMFISLFVLQIKKYIYLLSGIIAGFLVIILNYFFKNNLMIIISTILAATISYFIEKYLVKGEFYSK